MQACFPWVADLLEGVDKDNIMARSGDLIGWSQTRFVWRFGFCPGSDEAKAHKVNVGNNGFLWVICDKNGRAIGPSGSPFEIFWGFACELPRRFRDIIDAKIFTRKVVKA